ncbi:MAG: sigma-70 family RNA polymerase sigma factor [Chlorobi bacterium]|nr:sigma-70 family RNA polymerase sigma factor [Chlorobiota bacterium]
MESKEKDFLNILNENKKIIYKICHLYTNIHDDFIDLYQEIIYQLWKSYDKFEGKSGINTWIYRVALNTALYNLRKKETERKRIKRINNTDFEVPVNPESDELMSKLKMLIENLGDAEKSLLLLQLEGLSYKEISEISGLSISNVGTKLNRIRDKLRDMANNKNL